MPSELVTLFLNSPDVERWIFETDKYRKERETIKKRLGLGPGPVILFVGRMVPEKGVEELIEAYREVIRRDSLNGLQLLLVGEGPLLEPLQELCRVSGLDRVNFTGFVAPGDLYPYYAAADIFVLPSRYEPYGVVVQEAAAAHLPLIVSDCCGAAPELLHDRENGFIFRAGDSKKLVEAIIALLGLKDNWDVMGEKSRVLASRFGYSFCEEEFMKAISLSLAKR